MIKIEIELDEKVLREIVIDYLKKQVGQLELQDMDVKIEVKSKQNYKSEWEEASFRARLFKVLHK